MRDLVAVTCGHRDVLDDGPGEVKVAEDRMLEEVAPVEPVEINLSQSLCPHRDVAVGRIEGLPVAGGCLGKKAQDHVAETPDSGHPRQRPEVVEAVALGVVGLSTNEWEYQSWHVIGRHLTVAVELDENLGSAP